MAHPPQNATTKGLTPKAVPYWTYRARNPFSRVPPASDNPLERINLPCSSSHYTIVLTASMAGPLNYR